MSCYLIGLVANDGVFVLSVSPARKDMNPLVRSWGVPLRSCIKNWTLSASRHWYPKLKRMT